MEYRQPKCCLVRLQVEGPTQIFRCCFFLHLPYFLFPLLLQLEPSNRKSKPDIIDLRCLISAVLQSLQGELEDVGSLFVATDICYPGLSLPSLLQIVILCFQISHSLSFLSHVFFHLQVNLNQNNSQCSGKPF